MRNEGDYNESTKQDLETQIRIVGAGVVYFKLHKRKQTIVIASQLSFFCHVIFSFPNFLSLYLSTFKPLFNTPCLLSTMLQKKAIAAKLKCCQASLTVSKKTKKPLASTSSSYSKSQKNSITPHTSESPDSDVEMPQNDEDPDHHTDPESSLLLPTSILQPSIMADGIAATIEK